MEDKKIMLRLWIALAVITFLMFIFKINSYRNAILERKISLILDCRENAAPLTLIKGLSEEAEINGIKMEIEYPETPERGSLEEQKMLIEKQLSSGTDALIICPSDEEALKEWIAKKKIYIPIIFLYSDNPSRPRYADAGYDEMQTGWLLAKHIEESASDARIVLLAKSSKKSSIEKTSKAISLTLGGRDTEIIEYSTEAEAAVRLKKYARNGEKTIVIADRPETAVRSAMMAEDFKDWERQIYSIGINNNLLNFIENQKVDGALNWSEYSLGVRVVRAASVLFWRIDTVRDIKIPSDFIDHDNMFEIISNEI